jgi:hypothetical protein
MAGFKMQPALWEEEATPEDDHRVEACTFDAAATVCRQRPI